MLVEEGFLGMVMVLIYLKIQQQVVIIHGVSTSINVNLIATPEDFVWLMRGIITNAPRPQLLGFAEGTMHSSIHPLGVGRFRVEA